MSSNLEWEVREVFEEYKGFKRFDVVEVELVGKWDKTVLPSPPVGVIVHMFTTYRTDDVMAWISFNPIGLFSSIEVSHLRYAGRLTREEALTHWNYVIRTETKNKHYALEFVAAQIEEQNKILRPAAVVAVVSLIAVIIYGLTHAWGK